MNEPYRSRSATARFPVPVAEELTRTSSAPAPDIVAAAAAFRP